MKEWVQNVRRAIGEDAMMIADLTSDLARHIEKYVGPIRHGWNRDILGNPTPFCVIECEDRLSADVDVYSTLGLSNFPLRSRSTKKLIRQEIILLQEKTSNVNGIQSILIQLGRQCIDSGFAYLRGDAIGPLPFEINAIDNKAIYITSPSYYEAEFATKALGFEEKIVFAWAFWITASEFNFIQKKGWKVFEDILEDKGANVLEFDRESVV
jgi:Suppressor of fused protein (SUFU)